jgi:histidinol-phosphate/aromatic aminotransferase/cobyric acid decarboxylase-like protein
MHENVARVDRERSRLVAGLTAAGWNPHPSVTNFVLADLGTPERAAAMADGLMRRGLVPRTFPSDHPLARCLRVTVRADDENDRLLAAVRDLSAAPDALDPIDGGVS